jgi:glucose/arabinose dehydrogenase
MRARAIALATTAGATLAFGAVTAAAATPTGPPPPPTAPGGQQVKLIASGLQTPTSFAVGAGKVFEGDGGAETSKVPNGGVFMLSGGKGIKLPGPQFVSGLAWRKGALYVAGGTITKQGPKWQIQRWSGFNGTKFATRKAIWTGPKGFDGTNGIAFAPNGRLLLGVDVGLTNNNDHGPANKTPLLYKILSMNADGSGVKVFASGMRQPWQIAFAKGSNSPFVSNLGQNGPKSVKNPPDEVLRVKQGDNFGFPKCNRTQGSPCKGFAKPFKLFVPHTSIMGMAIIGQRLYMTSFVGIGGKGPGGEVLSMPLKGGAVKPVVTGFAAPTVGLGTDGHSLYIGEVGTGDVFKVTP